MPKTRNRSRSERQDLRYRIRLHTGDIKVVGQAQWNHHLTQTRNLVRMTAEPHLRELLARDHRLALVAPGLIAYENEETSQLVFEAQRGLGRPERSPHSNWEELLQAFLYMFPVISSREASDVMRSGQPRLMLGDAFDRQGRLLVY